MCSSDGHDSECLGGLGKHVYIPDKVPSLIHQDQICTLLAPGVHNATTCRSPAPLARSPVSKIEQEHKSPQEHTKALKSRCGAALALTASCRSTQRILLPTTHTQQALEFSVASFLPA